MKCLVCKKEDSLKLKSSNVKSQSYPYDPLDPDAVIKDEYKCNNCGTINVCTYTRKEEYLPSESRIWGIYKI